MEWKKIVSADEIAQLQSLSEQAKILIFKHSDRCGISRSVKSKLESDWKYEAGLTPFLVDVIHHRDVSGEVSRCFGVQHESPQALLIRNGKCIFHASHFDIHFSDLVDSDAQVRP